LENRTEKRSFSNSEMASRIKIGYKSYQFEEFLHSLIEQNFSGIEYKYM